MIDRVIGLVGLALAFVALVAPYRYPKIPRLVSDLGIAAGCIIIGLVLSPLVFKADGPAPAPSPQEERKPELHVSFSGADIFLTREPDYTGVALDTKVWNTGAPSVATDWSFIITPQGKLPVLGKLSEIPENLRLAGRQSDVIHSTDSLVDKTKTNPISEIPIEGKLLFYADINLQVAKDPTTKWEILVKDIYGQSSSHSKMVGDLLRLR
jgi:hypothetical protein